MVEYKDTEIIFVNIISIFISMILYLFESLRERLQKIGKLVSVLTGLDLYKVHGYFISILLKFVG